MGHIGVHGSELGTAYHTRAHTHEHDTLVYDTTLWDAEDGYFSPTPFSRVRCFGDFVSFVALLIFMVIGNAAIKDRGGTTGVAGEHGRVLEERCVVGV